MALKIKSIYAYEVLDSRGFPTVACVAKVCSGLFSSKTYTAKAIVPSGASTGEKEAVELRDEDLSRYLGKGVKKAVHNVNSIIAPALIDNGIDPADQDELDQLMIELDGTENKSYLGANAILSVSLAVAKAVAKAHKIPFYEYIASLFGYPVNQKLILPLPMVNVINGGCHADNTIDFQEFMFVPVGAKSAHEAVRISAECFHHLQKLLKSKGMNTNKGDEGGFAPNLHSVEEALNIMVVAVQKAGYKPGISGGDVAIALDCAASELYDSSTQKYIFHKAIAAGLMDSAKGTKTSKELINYYKSLIKKYPIISLEDPLGENDWSGFEHLMEEVGKQVQIVGDDLFCTNPQITAQGTEQKVANSILIKLNQIGTLTETLKTIQIAKQAGWTWIISHRSGETSDTSIIDIAVGTGSGQIKTGSMARSERLAKYNRLLEIELELGSKSSSFKGIDNFSSIDLSNEEHFKLKDFSWIKMDKILLSDSTQSIKTPVSLVKKVKTKKVK